MKLSTPIRFFFPAKSPDSIGPGSISSLEDFLSQATLGAERAVARVRLLVAGLVVAWFVVEDPNLAHWAPKDWIRVGVISIAALFSIYTLRALRRGVRAEQVLVLSVLFDPIGIGVVLLTGVVFGGPYEQGILRSFDLSTLVLSTLAAGARLSTRVARVGIATNATVFVGLILVDRMLHAYAPWRWVLLSGLLAAIIYSGCCFFAYELARRTRRLVIEGARSIVMAERAQSHLRTYLPEEVADAALETPKPSIGGERRDVAVLFSDLRGFTSYAESLPPETLVAELNAYLEAMLEAIAAEGGSVDKFIGDAIMVTFGAKGAKPDDAARAIRTATAMQRRVEAHNVERERAGRPPLRMGIGVHFGSAVAGNVGTKERMQFTVVGDVVNIASRLQAATKTLGRSVLVSAEAVASASTSGVEIPRLEPAGKLRVPGSNREHEVYFPAGIVTHSLPPDASGEALAVPADHPSHPRSVG